MTPVPPARDRLRIAIQKSGRLADPARALLASCGLSWRESRDRLFCYGETLPVDLLLVRDDDIPGLIAGVGIFGALSIVGASLTMASIAVLPFDNLSGDPSKAYFSDGLAAEVRAELARNPLLQVAAEHDLPVIEDACQAIGAQQAGRPAGTVGRAGCFRLSLLLALAGALHGCAAPAQPAAPPPSTTVARRRRLPRCPASSA